MEKGKTEVQLIIKKEKRGDLKLAEEVQPRSKDLQAQIVIIREKFHRAPVRRTAEKAR